MLKRIFVLFSIIFSFLLLGNAFAVENSRAVRVAISDTSFTSYTYRAIEFLNAQDLDIINLSTGEMISGAQGDKIAKIEINRGLFEVNVDNKPIGHKYDGFLTVRAKNQDVITVNGLKRAGKQAQYRGIFELIPTKDREHFYLVNILDVETYLKGVVPNEMPVRFGLEALKAQSIAARNYALAPRVKANKEFDLSDSVASQVYFGANTEKELSDRAVEETAGIIALSKEDIPILALYSSTAGGYTGSFENAFSDKATNEFPAKSNPNLQAKPDNPETPDLSIEENAKEFYTSTPETFDNNSPYFRWTREWSSDELENVLKKTLTEYANSTFVAPSIKESNDFGKLKDVVVLDRDKSGKVIHLQVITDKNIFVISKELVIRRIMKHNGKALPSANFVISKDEENGIYTIYGGGFGHGVGMSQWGAGRMSELGFNYEQILNHYYSDIRLTTLPEYVLTKDKELSQSFYTTFKNAWVYITHKKDINILYVNINDKTLEINLKGQPEKVKINISDYIKKGRNEVKYFINEELKEPNSLRVYVEIKGESDGK